MRRVVALGAQMPRTIEDLRAEVGCGRSEIYRHVQRAAELELLHRHDLIKGLPALVAATSEGHRFADSCLRPQRISHGGFQHMVVCSQIATDLRARYPGVEFLSEPELRLREAIADRPIASARVGRLPSGAARLHRPDLVLAPKGRKPTAIEVELTAKAPDRLRAIVTGWRRAECAAGVVYLCAPGKTHHAVRAAVDATRSHDRVRVLKLSQQGASTS